MTPKNLVLAIPLFEAAAADSHRKRFDTAVSRTFSRRRRAISRSNSHTLDWTNTVWIPTDRLSEPSHGSSGRMNPVERMVSALRGLTDVVRSKSAALASRAQFRSRLSKSGLEVRGGLAEQGTDTVGKTCFTDRGIHGQLCMQGQ